jgi:hypothetical protein
VEHRRGAADRERGRAVTREAMDEPRRRHSPRRTILTGAASLAAGVIFVFAPLLLGRGSLNRYLVLIGLLGVVVGASLVLHGTWDLLWERRG